MKKVLQGTFFPFVIFASGMLLLGCDQAQDHAKAQESAQTNDEVSEQADDSQQEIAPTKNKAELKSGNVFYIVRDAANLQLKAGDYIEKLKDTQLDVEQAIQDKDQQELKTTVTTLKQQLKGLNQVLLTLDIRSQEVENIRQNLLQANQQALSMPLLNGKLEQIDFDQIEKQLNTIQMDMVKLAALIMAGDEKSDSKTDS
ncbi:hypothetical protein KTI87_17310 [Acinetobacter nosocomialis]|uniref:hypothetical protein n=1 Tax=Acinetobacter nosocomialis TaxID=106654 RepID=UPI0021D25967|nr:hypothetical protein [Acinetobacter nosocomialis]MCU4554391.1 hypothetical protein [Acinetobacter nosocomialis]